MRLLAVLAALVLAGCGGGSSNCQVGSASYSFHATASFVTSGCETQPTTFDVTAATASTSGTSYTLSGTENGAAFTATGTGTSSDCYALPAWYDSAGATHMYFIALDGGQSRLDVVRTGQCMVSYTLR